MRFIVQLGELGVLARENHISQRRRVRQGPRFPSHPTASYGSIPARAMVSRAALSFAGAT
jgi:hypothetical protein